VLAISNHVALCEGHLRVTPELPLFQYYFLSRRRRSARLPNWRLAVPSPS
jgi:hypothetical protein